MKEPSSRAGSAITRVAAEQAVIHRRGFTNLLNDFLAPFYYLGGLIRRELKSPVDLSLKHSMRAWRYGLTRFSYVTYGLDQGGDPTDYLSDWKLLWTPRINGKFIHVVNNKLAFPLLMKHYSMPSPDIKGIMHRGLFYSFEPKGVMKPIRFLEEVCEGAEKLVLKPIIGAHGTGFMWLKRNDNDYQLNGANVPSHLLVEIIGKLDDYVVTDFVTQGEYASRLYPHTTNTIRVVTFWDSESEEAFVAKVVHRIGTSRSQPVDNFRAGEGGLSAFVDPDSGELGPGALVNAKGQVTWHSLHPESKAPIRGIVVPDWVKIRTNLLEYAELFSFAPCLGWDIVPTDSGFSIIEANSTPGLPVLQVHGPLLTDRRIRRFYQYHTVIP
jgi:hypothetical protein